jgi:hypothetical protein
LELVKRFQEASEKIGLVLEKLRKKPEKSGNFLEDLEIG